MTSTHFVVQDPYQELRTLSVGDERILAITLQPSDEKILCYTASNRLLSVVVPPIEVANQHQLPITASDFMLGGFHIGAIVGMAVAAQRPLVITIGVDRIARVWNYLQVRVYICCAMVL